MGSILKTLINPVGAFGGPKDPILEKLFPDKKAPAASLATAGAQTTNAQAQARSNAASRRSLINRGGDPDSFLGAKLLQ